MTVSPPRPPALDPAALPEENRTDYPEPYRALVAGRFRRPLGDALGLIPSTLSNDLCPIVAA